MGYKALNIDLHIHSTASDGTLSPSEIITLAGDIGLGAISITDHDTLEGSRQVIERGIPSSIRFLTGIEISAESPPFFPCPGSFHILGYAVRLDDPVMNETLSVLRDARENRNPMIIKRLNSIGFDISLDEVTAYAGNSQIGRPHIAGVMKQKGFVSTFDEAFDKYIGTGRPAYVDKYRISCEKAIHMIQDAGGLAVLAHPGLLKPCTDASFESAVQNLKDMGLQGIEVYYPEHSNEQTAFFADTARRFDLLMTGGTDFHGAIKPDICLGSGRGDFSVPYDLFEKLIRHI